MILGTPDWVILDIPRLAGRRLVPAGAGTYARWRLPTLCCQAGANAGRVGGPRLRKTTTSLGVCTPGSLQGSLNYLLWGDRTMQMYGDFEGFPLQ